MKKTISIIFVISMILTFVGCKEVKIENENSSVAEQTVIVETYKAEANEQTATTQKLSESENLSAEDKAVKAEIAKYNDDTANFRYNRQEKIGNKTYNLTFEKVGFAATGGDETERITYKNSEDDYFIYNLKTGNLETATFGSAITEKVETSIDINVAEKVAYNTALNKCDMSNYVLYEKTELSYGYSFKYNRYIGNYRTAEGINITVAFNGDIVSIGIWTDIFDGIELNISEDWINEKLDEAISYHNEGSVEVIDKWITEKDGKPCLMVVLSNNIVHPFTFE
ncbi:MAG: hypothetical protein IJY79_04675 [Clostridia bacterium]|nr:hypothetical protein [Clostridia bacterium]